LPGKGGNGPPVSYAKRPADFAMALDAVQKKVDGT
jgi:hypothetical protein